MTRTCTSCPQPHPIYMQAEPNWYRPSTRQQVMDAIGCAFSMIGILALAVFLWLTAVGVYMVVTG